MWEYTSRIAYNDLGIPDGASLVDEDVGVAYYISRSELPDNVERATNALEFIAQSRGSRFLRFLASIGEHLNEKNVAVLAKKTFASRKPENDPENFAHAELSGKVSPISPKPENTSEESVSAESVGEESLGGESSANLACESPESEMEMDAVGTATSEDSPSEPRSPSSPEASISSSNGTSADSDFSEEVSGIFFDNFTWRCEECYSVLVNGKCPNGHELRRCKTCDWQLDTGPCQRCLGICGACGGESLNCHCSSCETGEESKDDNTIFFDEGNGIWRCIYCSWEIEADNESDGNCHCLNGKGEAQFIDLSDYLDYEPADSCSSEDDSTDSESNSDDERFIDDSEVSIDGITSYATIETPNLAALYPAHVLPNIMKAAEMARGAKTHKDKENVGPTASSDEIEIIDAPTENVSPNLPSNIIDCESMDM